MSKRVKLVVVYWTDICSPGNYWSESEDHTIANCMTVGYLISKTKKSVDIAQSVALDETPLCTGGVISIPSGVIKKIVEIKTGPKNIIP